MQPSNTPEEWRPVVGYEGIYEVSDHGRVRSLDREIEYRDGRTRRHRGLILSPDRHRNGRLQVCLYLGGKGRQRMVHRLVLEAFVGPCPHEMDGCHWDDDPDNNHLSNLRWASRSDNMLDKVRNGNHNEARKTHCPRGHEYTEANTYIGRQTHGGVHRKCRTCTNEYQRAYSLRKKRAQVAAHVLGQEEGR